jgi:SagB-type dehydrogenase family enzyme
MKGQQDMDTIGREFIERTKYNRMESPDQSRGVPQPPLQLPHDPAQKVIPLPAPGNIRLGGFDVRKAIEQRRTVRAYARTPLTLDEFSYLLWCTQGVREVIQSSTTRRTVPSAGARHAFETYVLANNVDGLPPGIYRFLALEHALVQEGAAPDLADRFMRACRGQEHVKTCGALFIWTAVAYRMTWRYGERGYRYLYLDAGHVCQNLYLSAESMGCGVCAIAAYNDDEVDGLLGLDGEERFAIYLATVGKK